MKANLPAEQSTGLEIPDEIDWEDRARAAIRATDTTGTSKLTKATITRLCHHLADGIPLRTAAKLAGTAQQTLNKWQQNRPAIATLIEEAQAFGELCYIKTIQADKGYKAQAYMLERMNSGYGSGDAAVSRNGVNITINVPIPGDVQAGQQPMIDITPDTED